MAKQIKLTDKVWWKLKLRAEQDGLTLAGEIQKLVDAETLPDLVERLEQAVDRLEAVPPAPEKLKPTKKSELSGVNWDEIAREMHRDR